jgi:hypothetical protein
MGTLSKYNLAGMRVLHGLRSFVETGTAQGDGTEQARAAGFDPIHTIEVVPEIAAAARFRFAEHKQVRVWEGSSVSNLPLILKDLPAEPCLFWLDAHFPGAHHGADYAAEQDAAVRLPLEEEIRMIRAARPLARDVLLIDDARIYVPGPYGAGDLPADWPAVHGIGRGPKRLDFVRELYGSTHGMIVDYADQGYLMVFPRILADLKAA